MVTGRGLPLCWDGVHKNVAALLTINTEKVTCVHCLRILAKGRGKNA